jgi:hypothetical protein
MTAESKVEMKRQQKRARAERQQRAMGAAGGRR